MSHNLPNRLEVGDKYSSVVEAEVVGSADVIVVGGGTAGCLAALAAARQGVKVLLIENRGFLGGMMTAGNAGLTKYTVHDSRPDAYDRIEQALDKDAASVQIIGGISMEMTRRLIDNGMAVGTRGQAGAYVFTAQQEFKWLLLDMMEEAGVDLLFRSMCVDVIKKDDAIRGVVVENKSGRQVLLGRVVIDATGDADVAARAGAPFVIGVGPDDLVAADGTPHGTMMGMGAMFLMGNVNLEKCLGFIEAHPDKFRIQECAVMGLGKVGENLRKNDMACFYVKGGATRPWYQIYNSALPGVVTVHTNTGGGDGLCAQDITRNELLLAKKIQKEVAALKAAAPGFEDAFVMHVPEVGARETRHIRGEYVLTARDICEARAFGDTIGRGSHPFDVGPIPDSLKNIELQAKYYFNIPYRCLVPLEVDNLLVAGRCISATHEAFGCIRPTGPCMVTGEAAGTAAGLCLNEGASPRSLDVSCLRRTLCEQGAVL